MVLERYLHALIRKAWIEGVSIRPGFQLNKSCLNGYMSVPRCDITA